MGHRIRGYFYTPSRFFGKRREGEIDRGNHQNKYFPGKGNTSLGRYEAPKEIDEREESEREEMISSIGQSIAGYVGCIVMFQRSIKTAVLWRFFILDLPPKFESPNKGQIL